MPASRGTEARRWDRTRILRRVRELHREGADLSYNAVARREQSLLSACQYYFGSYRRAILMAGLDYDRICRKPWWTKAWIVRLIKTAHREKQDLSWRAVVSRRDALGRAASAAVHPHLFGNWNDALTAAGLNPEKISRYRHWGREAVLEELRKRSSRGKPVNSGAIQAEVPGMYRGAVREFGSFDAALAAAGLDPQAVRRRRRWTRAEALREMKDFHRRHGSLASTVLRRYDSGLERTAVRFFKTLPAARKAAGVR